MMPIETIAELQIDPNLETHWENSPKWYTWEELKIFLISKPSDFLTTHKWETRKRKLKVRNVA